MGCAGLTGRERVSSSSLNGIKHPTGSIEETWVPFLGHTLSFSEENSQSESDLKIEVEKDQHTGTYRMKWKDLE